MSAEMSVWGESKGTYPSFSGTDTFNVATAHSQYNAPGFNTSPGITSGTWVICTGILNGIERKAQIAWPFLGTWRRSEWWAVGWRIYVLSEIQNVSRKYRATMQINSQDYSERCRTYRPIGVEDSWDGVDPSYARTHAATMFDDYVATGNRVGCHAIDRRRNIHKPAGFNAYQKKGPSRPLIRQEVAPVSAWSFSDITEGPRYMTIVCRCPAVVHRFRV